MKLYFATGTCSLAPHIVLNETGLKFQTERVDIRTKTTASGSNFFQINPKGYVPVLETQTGEILTEAAVILQYIADRAPEKDLIPRQGTFERYRMHELLHFISTEVHKSYGLLFNPKFPEDARQMTVEKMQKRFELLDQQLQGRQFLTGSTFTVADAYFFTIMNWANYLKVDVTRWKNILGFMERVSMRPSVQAAMKIEYAK